MAQQNGYLIPLKKTDALQPYQAIRKQLEQIATHLGMTLETFALVVVDDPDFCDIQCQFTIRADAVMSEAEREQAEFDRQFEEIEQRTREQEIMDKKVPKIKADIDEWLQED